MTLIGRVVAAVVVVVPVAAGMVLQNVTGLAARRLLLLLGPLQLVHRYQEVVNKRVWPVKRSLIAASGRRG